MAALTIPSPDQLAHSANLVQAIHAEIAASGGWIPFARYMELALYAPGLGYYSAGMRKFGADGDFVTAPEISPLFARCVARQAAQVLKEAGGDVLELGAGTGRLAAQLLLELQRLDCLPECYRILEVSAYLREVQRETLAASLPQELLRRVEWLEALPTQFQGFVFANEVLDALPVHILAWREDGIHERGVAWREAQPVAQSLPPRRRGATSPALTGHLVWQECPLPPGTLRDMAERLQLPPGYVSELCPAAPALIASLAEMLQRGALLFIDYGFARREYYHPQRASGTLMCHYRQHAHDDPLLYPGLQDITAHVDFTAVAEASTAHGLRLLGYASQAQFLINCGITEMLAAVSPADMAAYLPLASQAQKLLSPAEMGELFKVTAFGKGLEMPPLGFTRGDKRHAL